MTQKNTIFVAVESGLGLVTFLLVAGLFPSGGALVRDKGLTNFWVIPVLFYAVAILLAKIAEGGEPIPTAVRDVYFALASGTWLGLSFGAVLILNEWYANPDNGQWEPLFTATGLSSAGVLAAARSVRKLTRQKPDAPDAASESPPGRDGGEAPAPAE